MKSNKKIVVRIIKENFQGLKKIQKDHFDFRNLLSRIATSTGLFHRSFAVSVVGQLKRRLTSCGNAVSSSLHR